MNFIAFGHHVIVKKVKFEKPQTEAEKLGLDVEPTQADDVGEIVSIPDSVYVPSTGGYVDFVEAYALEEGYKITFKPHGVREKEVDGIKFLIVPVESIDGVLSEPA